MDPVQEPLSVFTAISTPSAEPSAEPSAIIPDAVLTPDTISTSDTVLTPDPITNTCESCDKQIQLADAIICKLCDEDYDSEDSEDEPSDKKESQHLFCKKCTRRCFVCNVRGCTNCVEVVCCDCGERMCSDCRNNDDLCGCYGHCSSCGTEVNRGADGWPCGECDQWLCSGCCRCDNSCPECGTGEESDDDDE